MQSSARNGRPWLSAVIWLFWFSLYTYSPYLTDHIVSLGASLSFAGVVTGLYGLVQMVLRIPAGRWSDRLGRRQPFVVAGCVLSAASAAGLFLAKTPLLVLVFRSLAGAAAACWVQMSVLFASYFEAREAAGAVSSALSLNTLGQLLGVAAGTAVTLFLPVPATFLLALVGGLAGLFCAAFVRETPGPRALDRLVPALLADRPAFIRLLSASVLAILGQILMFGGPYGFAPRLAKEVFAASPLQMGFLTIASSTTVVFASRFVNPPLHRRVGPRKTLLFGFLLCSLYFLSIPLLKSFPMLLAMQALYGLGHGTFFPVLMSRAVVGVPEARRGVFMGVFQSVYGIGMFLGPSLVGLLGDLLGLTVGFSLTGLTGLLACVLAFVLPL